MSDSFYEIELEILQMTDDAVFLTDGDIEEWIPWSQIKQPNMYERGMIGFTEFFEIREWILGEKGFI